MRVLTLPLSLLAVGVIAGCGEHAAKDAVKRLLNDPESAQFSGIQPGKNPGDYCGMVNAKNRMGGYVGFTPFFYRKPTDTVAIVKAPDSSDFRSLWHAIQLNGDVTERLMKLSQACRLMSEWDSVCRTPHPEQTHPLCQDVQGGGSGLFQKLKDEFGR